MKNPEVGMKVKYSHAWLKSTGADKDSADLVGEILEVRKIPMSNNRFYCRVLWNTGEYYGILNTNLIQVKDGNLIDPTE